MRSNLQTIIKRILKKYKINFKFLNSKRFINFIQTLTSIKEKILPDLELNGGGLHEIKKVASLKYIQILISIQQKI